MPLTLRTEGVTIPHKAGMVYYCYCDAISLFRKHCLPLKLRSGVILWQRNDATALFSVNTQRHHRRGYFSQQYLCVMSGLARQSHCQSLLLLIYRSATSLLETYCALKMFIYHYIIFRRLFLILYKRPNKNLLNFHHLFMGFMRKLNKDTWLTAACLKLDSETQRYDISRLA